MNYEIKPIDNQTARELIVKNHYSHGFPRSGTKVALGMFDGETLIGCIVYGHPICRSSVMSISPLLQNGEVVELTRLWIQDGTPKNSESWLIGQSFSWLRNNLPTVKVIISYADPDAGHRGMVYQATNFHYQYLRSSGGFVVSLTEPTPSTPWIHTRTLVHQYGTGSFEKLKSIIPKPYWVRHTNTKHRYLYFLGGKSEKKRLLSTLVHPILPYPKEITTQSKVEMIS